MQSATPFSHFFILGLLTTTAWSAGLVRDGFTARTQSMGGASVAVAGSPLEAMMTNPAALTEIKNGSAEVSVDGVFLHATLTRTGEKKSTLRNRINFLGDVAIALPVGHPAIRWGLSAAPSYAAATDWRYRDRDGGVDGRTSYGEINHHSEFLAYNFQTGLGVDFSSWFSAGVSAGFIYNHNALSTAYIFQSQKTLRGFKTQLDLDTEGYAAVGQIGFTLKPLPSLRISAAYTTPSEFHTEGDARANLSAQLKSLGGGFAAVEPELNADAKVVTKLPQKIEAGIAWQPTEKLLLTTEFDWINWSNAFDELPVTLSHSSNAVVNGLVGSDQFTDVVPLGWRDQKIIRVGAEYKITDAWRARAGYAYSNQVIPNQTLTPLAAAIDDSIVSAGIGYQQSQWHLDFSWQWHLPKTQFVSQSQLKAGEYSNSEIQLESHWLGLTYGLNF